MPTHLILERVFDPPLTVADVHGRVRESAWCFEMHRVAWRASLLAADGQRMVCWFEAPDAESARIALRQSGAEIGRLWAGTVHDAPQSAVPNVLVERSFDEPVALEDIQAIEDALSWCLDAHGVRFARTFFAADRRRMLCLYEAPDAEAVRVAQRQASMPVSAVWAFTRIAPDTM